MNKLPLWSLMNKTPAFYDTESATVIEQTAKLYGAMNELIEEHNNFVNSINEQITKIETITTTVQAEYESRMNKLIHDFIHCTDTKIDSAVNYMKMNLKDSLVQIVKEGLITIEFQYNPTEEELKMTVTESEV